jgi:hypothetical protein
MKLIDFIGNDAVIDDLCSTDKEAVIREMVEILKKLNKIKGSDVHLTANLFTCFFCYCPLMIQQTCILLHWKKFHQ